MEAAFAAARLGDPIEHTKSLGGFLIGAAIGFAVGLAIIAATVITGGAALAVIAAAGGAIAATGGMALLGEKLGSTSPTPAGTIAPPCDTGIIINDRPAARAIIDTVNCSKDGPTPQKIAQGSKTVFLNGYPAARQGDLTQCDASIAHGSPDVFIGADPGTYMDIHGEVPDWMNNLANAMVLVGSAIALSFGAAAAFAAGGLCALAEFGGTVVGGMIGGAAGGKLGGAIGKSVGGERGQIIGEAVGATVGGFIGGGLGARATAGHPVDVATGELFTTETDFSIAGPLPLVWSRVWISSSTLDGELGHGWHHRYDLTLRLWPEGGGCIVRLGDGRLAFFALPTPSAPALNIVERLWLQTDGQTYRLVDYAGLAHEFGPPVPGGLRPLVRVADANGNTIRLERDGAGHLIGIEDSAGRRYAVGRDDAGRILTIDAPHPDRDGEMLRLVTYGYDATGNLIAATDARDHAFAYGYEDHLLVEERRRGGLTFRFVWDRGTPGHPRCVETWGDDGLYYAKLAFDDEAQTTRVTNGRGAVMQYRWNAIGLIEEAIDPLGAVTRRHYDEAGRVVRLQGPDGATLVNRYDDFGRLVERTDPAGGTTRLAYALQTPAGIGHGNPSQFVGPDGAEDRFRYDARGNLAIHLDPTGRERRIARDTRGLPLALIDGAGTARRFTWSPAGDLVAEGTERGARRQIRYDRLGRVIEVRRGADAPVRLVRDAAGNVVEIERPDGGKIVLDYDPENKVVRHRDAVGRETRWRYDGLPFPQERVTPDGARFCYAYDSELNLIGLENQKGERYRLDYDLAGRLVREVCFDGRTLEHDYDAGGRLIEQRDVGRPTRFRRDKLGRLLEKRFADGTSHRFGWNDAGQLVAATNDARVLGFDYDPAGRLLAEVQDDQVLRHAYDARGRRIATRLPDGRTVELSYGADGLPEAVGFDGRSIARFARDAAGREIERRAGAIYQTQDYDPQGRLIAQRGQRHSGGQVSADPVFARGYGYDGTDALVQLDDLRRGLKRYQYDACDRLLAVEAAEPEAFVVDPAGNILADGRDGAFWGGSAKGDRLLVHGDRKFTYDDYGNRIHEVRATGGAVAVAYRYGPDNQLVEVDETGRLGRRLTRFRYDALGRRVSKATTELAARPPAANAEAPNLAAASPPPADGPAWQCTNFLWDGNLLLAESDTAADPLATVYLFEPGSFRPLAQIRRPAATAAGTAYHYHLDHLGTPQELTNDNGEVVWAGDLKAWGGLRRTIVARVENPLRFQGQYHDRETGLHYNRFRYYAPNEGRFISQDPIRLRGGTNVSAYAPNPVQWVDPLGLACGFATQDEAAKAALDKANPASINDNLEYGGLIHQHNTSGEYGYSGPVRGTDQGVNPWDAGTPPNTTVVGDYHTHADYSVVDPNSGQAIRTSDPARDDFNSDNFSSQDYQGIRSDGAGNPGYKGYLGTPSGTYKVFDPATGKVGILGP